MSKSSHNRRIQSPHRKSSSCGGINLPTQILTIGKVVAVTFLHLPLQGKITFVDIADEENAELLYRFCYHSNKFRKFAETLLVDTYVVAEGEISPHNVLKPLNEYRSILLIAGKVFRVLQRPATCVDPPKQSG